MTNPSSLSGQRLGTYEVGPLIGAGGMGEVYRARDSKLHRDVAIKVLLPAVAGDTERLARFSREAQVLASLNHPGIAHIHGLEEGDSGPFLVMELVEGPTLADRIKQGPLPVDEATAIARLIAEALEAAHERGVIHRDLKPANIKVGDDGTVKVLDFGLAKALDPAAANGAQSANSPTITTPAMTQAGIILGTAAYMSPEQAKGRVVDKRTDIWAFGCVLYEMLTGRRAFDGEDVTDTIAAVVRGEPDWNALPAETPPQLRLLLKRCLEKDRRTRIGDIGVARFLLNETIDATSPAATSPASQPPVSRKRLMVASGIAFVSGATLLAIAVWALRTPPSAPQMARFAIVPPATQALATAGIDRNVAISPDGSLIVYRVSNSDRGILQGQLAVRRMNEIDAQILNGTAGANSPFFSPDGKWVAFFTAPGELKKVSIGGGAATTVSKMSALGRDGNWGPDDTIVFALQGAVHRVSAAGGEPTELIAPDRTKFEVFRSPLVLPGGDAIVFTSFTGPTAQIEALDLKTRQRKVLIPGGISATYANDGYLVFAVTDLRDVGDFRGSLNVVRFDAKRLTVTSDHVSVVDQVLIRGFTADYALSGRGSLVYVPADEGVLMRSRPRSLVWVDRKGVEESIGAPEREYALARLSPEGTRVALEIRDQRHDIWIWDLTRKTLTPLNRDPAQDMSPVWMPDGRRVVWTSARGGGNPNLYWQLADGTGAADRLTSSGPAQFPTSIRPDGTHALIFATGGATAYDVFEVPLNANAAPRPPGPLVQSPMDDFDADLSPDGKWVAYHSNESGEFQVYVRPYPNVNGGRWQISTTGGTRAAWARSGRELFYLDENGLLTAVAVETKGNVLTAGPPATLLKTSYSAGFSTRGLHLRAFDVSPDGQRFLMIKEKPEDQPPAASPRMIVLLNWFEELRARLPAR